MDANGQRFWLLGEAAHFPALQHALWDPGCRLLRLASERTLQPALAPAAAFAAAQSALERVPRAIDSLACVARWDAASGAVRVKSDLPDEVELLPLAETPSDLCAAPDGVLYIALPGAVRLHDLRGRWSDASVALAGFTPWRLAPGGLDGQGWPLGRSVRSRELEVEVSRVPGVDEIRGLRLFRQQGRDWQPLPAIAADGAQVLALQPWQLPELLSVVALEGAAAPNDLRALPNPFAEATAVAVPVVPELC